MASRLSRWLREPALHFAGIGLALFALHARVSRPPAEHLAIAPAFVEGLIREHTARTGKAPTAQETQALVDRFIDEELLVREAVALGLDRGDPIVRRRLVQKMETLADGASPVAEPTDAELQAWLDAHADRFPEPGRVGFHHVFVSRDRHGDAALADAQKLRAELVAGADPATLGDPFFQGSAWAQRSEKDLAAVFGASFADHVAALAPGAWSEPIASSYGVHLVRVDARSAGGPASLATVRDRVREELTTERREQRRAEATRALRARYRVEVQLPAPSSSVEPGSVARRSAP